MSLLHFLSGMLLEAMVVSLLAGMLFAGLLPLLFRFVPRLPSSQRYQLYSSCLLILVALFLQPFVVSLLDGSIAAAAVAPAKGEQVKASVSSYRPAADAVTVVAQAPGRLEQATLRLMRNAPVILGVYIAGFLCFLARFLWSAYMLRRLRRYGLQEADILLLEALKTAREKLGIRRRLRISFSSAVQVPCIVGWARAVVLIPVALAGQLSTAQAEAVLMHELGHFRMYHHYINVLAQAGIAVLFFNPFAWLLLRQGSTWREYACDELARKHDHGIALAESLLLIARNQRNTTHPLLLTLSQSKGPLFNRINHLLHMKTSSSSSSRVVLPLLLTLLIGAACCFTTLRARPLRGGQTDTLGIISRELRAKGNMNFIILEALRDSLIRTGEPYEISYVQGVVSVNKTRLTGPLQGRYQAMFESMKDKTYPGSLTSWVSNSDSVTWKEIVDPQSVFRNPPAHSAVFARASDAVLIQGRKLPVVADTLKAADCKGVSVSGPSNVTLAQLLAEGITVPGKPIMLESKKGRIFVNGRSLSPAQQEKYPDLIRATNGCGEPIVWDASVVVYPDGVLAPQSGSVRFPRNADSKGNTLNTADPKVPTRAAEHSELLEMLVSDGLVQTEHTIHLSYSVKGIFINDRKLEGVIAEKYIRKLTGDYNYPEPKGPQDLIDMTF